jgi:hypothetical protein
MSTKTAASGSDAPTMDVENFTLAQKVIEHITVSHAAMEKAAAAEKQARQQQAAIADLIPKVVDAMVQHDRIQPTEREKLASLLQDPVETLRLMAKVAAHRTQAELARLGAGVADDRQKQASDSTTSAFVGGHASRVKQSSIDLFRGLGLPTPDDF